jgi:hypothetical protein
MCARLALKWLQATCTDLVLCHGSLPLSCSLIGKQVNDTDAQHDEASPSVEFAENFENCQSLRITLIELPINIHRLWMKAQLGSKR